MAGLRPIFDGSRPISERVVNVTVRCIECDVPRYEPLQLDKYYKVVTQSFIGDGGDGFTVSCLKQVYNNLFLSLFILNDFIIFNYIFFSFIFVLIHIEPVTLYTNVVHVFINYSSNCGTPAKDSLK